MGGSIELARGKRSLSFLLILSSSFYNYRDLEITEISRSQAINQFIIATAAGDRTPTSCGLGGAELPFVLRDSGVGTWPPTHAVPITALGAPVASISSYHSFSLPSLFSSHE